MANPEYIAEYCVDETMKRANDQLPACQRIPAETPPTNADLKLTLV
jgi:hypothetical protein